MALFHCINNTRAAIRSPNSTHSKVIDYTRLVFFGFVPHVDGLLSGYTAFTIFMVLKTLGLHAIQNFEVNF